MEHTKIIKDERGTVLIKVRLIVQRFTPDYSGNWFEYEVRVTHILPKKRKEQEGFGIATVNEIHRAKLELWEMLKP